MQNVHIPENTNFKLRCSVLQIKNIKIAVLWGKKPFVKIINGSRNISHQSLLILGCQNVFKWSYFVIWPDDMKFKRIDA